LRVLLVEDELEMAAALGAALKKYSMVVDHVSTVADAEEALLIMLMGPFCWTVSSPIVTA
jgi:DNA-binding response OmpR family regulator